VLLAIYKKYKEATPKGLLLGLFFVLVFTARFFIEFTKENQAAFEGNLPLNMGQILSLPLIAFGIWLIVTSRKR
jgi:prolipoprotein diacylglyceryltransferase